jgi:hypothetical protein
LTEIPTTERLALALVKVGAPPLMIERAREGYYDDYKSPLAMPETQLLIDAREARLGREFYGRIVDGEFDATKAEAEEWAASPDGQETFRQLLGRPHP